MTLCTWGGQRSACGHQTPFSVLCSWDPTQVMRQQQAQWLSHPAAPMHVGFFLSLSLYTWRGYKALLCCRSVGRRDPLQGWCPLSIRQQVTFLFLDNTGERSHTCTHMYTCIHTHEHKRAHTYTCRSLCTHTYTLLCACRHPNMSTHMHRHIHTPLLFFSLMSCPHSSSFSSHQAIFPGPNWWGGHHFIFEWHFDKRIKARKKTKTIKTPIPDKQFPCLLICPVRFFYADTGSMIKLQSCLLWQ